MDFNIDNFLTEKLEVTPCGVLGAYAGAYSGLELGFVGGLIVGNALNKPLGNLFLQLWNGYVGYRVQFWAEKTKYDYQMDFENYKKGILKEKPTMESVIQSDSFIHALNLNKLKNTIIRKIAKIPEHKRIHPKLEVIGPLLKDAEYYADAESIRELYSGLVAASLNADFAEAIHPAFASIIHQIAPNDALLLMKISTEGYLASYRMIDKRNSDNTTYFKRDVYLGNKKYKYNFQDTLSFLNFERLKLIEITRDLYPIFRMEKYKCYENNPIYQMAEDEAKRKFGQFGDIELEKEMFVFTDWGSSFKEVCLS